MNPDTLKARSRLLRNLVTMVFVILALTLAMEVSVVASGRYPSANLLIYRLPMLFYLWAIWCARRAIASIGAGESFGPAVPRLLTQIGLALFLGGIVNVFVAPILSLLVFGRGALAHYDVAAITVGVVGLTLILVAQLLGQAAAMRRELDEMF
jgi:hypothetical protein